MDILVNIKPLSVNEAWKGRRYKTDKYNSYQKQLLLQLPNIKIDFKGSLRAEITFGVSNKGSDIDNPLKPLIDVLQKKYGFNDNQIYELTVKKEIVPKGSEFFKVKINEI